MKRILLVEDNPADVVLTRAAIDPNQFQLTQVSRLQEAIQRLGEDWFDVVLLDLGLPDSQGLVTLQKLLDYDGSTPIVILSGQSDEALALEAVTAGAQDYMVKDKIEGGNLSRAVHYAIERRRFQDRLRLSESRLAEAVRIAQLGYWSRDLDTGYLEWSDLLYEMFDVNRQEFDHTAEAFFSLLHPEDADQLRRRVPGLIQSKNSFEHYYRINVRGQTRVIHEIGKVYLDKDGKPARVAGTARDVTETVQAQDALRLRDRAINAASQGIVICDFTLPDHPIVYVSPGFERMTGYLADEVMGKNCRFLQGPETNQESVDRIRLAVKSAKPFTIELLNYRKCGTPFWNELSISPIHDENGKLTHFVGVQTDITMRKQLEEGLRQTQKLEAVGKLAGGIAHDFNNLLTVINGYSEILLQSTPETDPNRPLLSEIQKAGDRSADLTRQLLAFSYQQVLSPRQLDLNIIVNEAEKFLRRVIGEDVQLRTDLEAKIGTLLADQGQMEQILMNLAVNARDAMPTGGTLTIRTENVELDEEFAQAHPGVQTGQYVLLTVTDTGCGMSDEVKSRIFDPFFTTKGAGKGTGLGLATVFSIVKGCGGLIQVDSTVGLGTTFRLYFPRTGNAEHATMTRVESKKPPSGSETILLVEDEAGVRSLSRQILIDCGYTVFEATDGVDALQVAKRIDGPIDMLITDVVMPGPSGWTIAENLRRMQPGIKVLFMSGYTDDSVIRHGVMTDQVDFLQKPFSPFALGQKVRDILDRDY